jgi:hypothetical protein
MIRAIDSFGQIHKDPVVYFKITEALPGSCRRLQDQLGFDRILWGVSKPLRIYQDLVGCVRIMPDLM